MTNLRSSPESGRPSLNLVRQRQPSVIFFWPGGKHMNGDALERLARKQFGVFTRAQALEVTSSSAIGRRLAVGEWERIHHRVYRFRGCPSFGHQPLMAAWLAAGSSAVVSHGS